MISVNEMKAQARFGFMKNVAEIYEYYQKYLKKNILSFLFAFGGLLGLVIFNLPNVV